MKNILMGVLVVLVAACGGAKLAVLSQADADRGAAKFPGTTVASLTQGKAYFEQHCQSCHALKAPASQTEERWRVIVPDMVRKVNKKSGSTMVNADMQESILRYLVTMGSAPAPKK